MRPIVNVPKEDRATAIGNMHKKLGKDPASDILETSADEVNNLIVFFKILLCFPCIKLSCTGSQHWSVFYVSAAACVWYSHTCIIFLIHSWGESMQSVSHSASVFVLLIRCIFLVTVYFLWKKQNDDDDDNDSVLITLASGSSGLQYEQLYYITKW